MTLLQKQSALTSREAIERHFQGAVIDEDGSEVPITRDMIRQACHALESAPAATPSVGGERRQHLS